VTICIIIGSRRAAAATLIVSRRVRVSV